MLQRLFGPKEQQCLVYPRPDQTAVVARRRTSQGGFASCEPVFSLGPRPYPADLGKAVLKALKGGKAPSTFVAGPDEPCLVCQSNGGTLTVEGQAVEADPLRLGLLLLSLAARPAEGSPIPQEPTPFHPPCAWLAAACESELLLCEMGLRQVRPVSWQEGLSQTPGRVFVTPRLEGWSLAVGLPYPDPEAEVQSDPLLLYLESLSQRAHKVCYFACDPGQGLFAWARTEEGTIVRAYAYLGEIGTTLWRLGHVTEAEQSLPAFFDETSDEAEEPGYFERTDLTYPDESSVLAIARAWALDPTTLKGEPSTGWSGALSVQ